MACILWVIPYDPTILGSIATECRQGSALNSFLIYVHAKHNVEFESLWVLFPAACSKIKQKAAEGIPRS